MTVVADLEGLLTPYGLALLLTSEPGDAAPFSDHDFFGYFRVLEARAVETQIQETLAAGDLKLDWHGRLIQ